MTHRFHLPHLRTPTPRKNAPAATPTPAATGATLPNTFTGATGRAANDTAGRSTPNPGETTRRGALQDAPQPLRPAEPFTHTYTTAEVQVGRAHNIDDQQITLADVQRAEMAAARLGDVDRAARYRTVARAFLARAQKDTRP